MDVSCWRNVLKSLNYCSKAQAKKAIIAGFSLLLSCQNKRLAIKYRYNSSRDIARMYYLREQEKKSLVIIGVRS